MAKDISVNMKLCTNFNQKKQYHLFGCNQYFYYAVTDCDLHIVAIVLLFLLLLWFFFLVFLQWFIFYFLHPC